MFPFLCVINTSFTQSTLSFVANKILLTKYTFMMHATLNRLMVTPSTIDMDFKMYGGDFEDDDMDALEI